MIEYLYNAIRATAGEDITIAAKLTNDDGSQIVGGCHVMLSDDEKVLITVDGECVNGTHNFTIPAAATKGLHGRYWYCICSGNASLCFKEPIYLI